MDMQRAPVVEHQELVLGALFDGDDPAFAQRGERARRDATLERGMEQGHSSDLLTYDDAADTARRAFDFGELGHQDDRDENRDSN
jgi:hypothetical protein